MFYSISFPVFENNKILLPKKCIIWMEFFNVVFLKSFTDVVVYGRQISGISGLGDFRCFVFSCS